MHRSPGRRQGAVRRSWSRRCSTDARTSPCTPSRCDRHLARRMHIGDRRARGSRDALVSNSSMRCRPAEGRARRHLQPAAPVNACALSATEILSLRGNVNSRLTKLDGGEFDAIILCAGLKRLGLGERIRELAPEICCPPSARASASNAAWVMWPASGSSRPLHHRPATRRRRARAQRTPRGGCRCRSPPLPNWMRMYCTCALVGEPDGSHLIRGG